eukprot:m51a1_g6626 hypothetical protein (649) ;mRNA; r:57708-59739
MASLFQSLPQQLVASELLPLLPHRSLCALSRTSRALRSLCAHPSLWSDVTLPASLASVASLAASGRPVRRLCLVNPLGHRADGPVLRALLAALAGTLVEVDAMRMGPMPQEAVAELAQSAGKLEVARFRVSDECSAATLEQFGASRGPTLRVLCVLLGQREPTDESAGSVAALFRGLRRSVDGAARGLPLLSELRVQLGSEACLRLFEDAGPVPFPSLRALEIGRLSAATRRWLAGAAPGLRTLKSWAKGAEYGDQESTLAEMRNLSSLEYVYGDIDFAASLRCQFLSGVVAPRSALSLEHLSLITCQADCEHVSGVTSLFELCSASLTSLKIERVLCGVAGALSLLPNVTVFQVEYVDPRCVDELRPCGFRLRELRLNSVQPLSYLLGLPMCSSLESLVLQDADGLAAVSDVGLLARCPSLRYLKVHGGRHADQEKLAALLGACKSLVFIEFVPASSSDIAPAASMLASTIAEMPVLRRFSLQLSSLSDCDPALLAPLAGLATRLEFELDEPLLPQEILGVAERVTELEVWSDDAALLLALFSDHEKFCDSIPKRVLRLKIDTFSSLYIGEALRAVIDRMRTTHPLAAVSWWTGELQKDALDEDIYEHLGVDYETLLSECNRQQLGVSGEMNVDSEDDAPDGDESLQ